MLSEKQRETMVDAIMYVGYISVIATHVLDDFPVKEERIQEMTEAMYGVFGDDVQKIKFKAMIEAFNRFHVELKAAMNVEHAEE